MANTAIQLKKSGQTGNVPSALSYGEVAINYADGKLYYKDASNNINYIENQDTFSTINVDGSLILATNPIDTLSLLSGNNIVLTPDVLNNKITVSTSNTINVANLVTSNILFSDGTTIQSAANLFANTAATANVSVFARITNVSTGTYFPLVTDTAITGSDTLHYSSNDFQMYAGNNTFKATGNVWAGQFLTVGSNYPVVNSGGYWVGRPIIALANQAKITNATTGTYYPILTDTNVTGNDTLNYSTNGYLFYLANSTLRVTGNLWVGNTITVGENYPVVNSAGYWIGQPLLANTSERSNVTVYTSVSKLEDGIFYPVLIGTTNDDNLNFANSDFVFNATEASFQAAGNVYVGENLYVTGTPLTRYTFTGSQFANSYRFNGSQYLQISNTTSILVPGTKDFTVEAFIYSTNVTSTRAIVSKGSAGMDWFFGTTNSGKLYFDRAGSLILQSANSISSNTWTHVAVSRTNGTLYLFINGVQEASLSDNTNYDSTDTFRIGRGRETSSIYFTGFISNLRYVNGTGLYTSNFTPDTTNTLTAIANTVLLTAQSSTMRDNGPYGFTLSNYGGAGVTANSVVSPYTSTYKVFVDLTPTSNVVFQTGKGIEFFDGTKQVTSFAAAAEYANSAFLQANAAYNLANTLSSGSVDISARETANSAGSYANSAFIKANSAYQSQNTTGTYANSAYDQANTATTNASTADSKAVTAGSYANSGFSVANSAALYANGAFIQANAAYNQANIDFTNISISSDTYGNSTYIPVITVSANGRINSISTIVAAGGGASSDQFARDTANSAGSYANSAYNQANTATTNAATADSKAVTAGSYANSAYNQANTATTNASTADSKAVTAGSYANSAYTQANTATTNAATADSKAVTAGSYANSAFAAANSAGSYANSSFLRANSSLSTTGGTVTGNVTLSTTATMIIQNTTPTTSNSTGALIVQGGLAVRGNTWISGVFTVDGDFQVGNQNTSGNVYNTGIVTFTQPTFFTNVAAASSNTTGGIVVTGGAGIRGNVYTGNLFITGAASNGITFVDGTRQTTSFAAAASYANSAFLQANAAFDLANTISGGSVDVYAREVANAAFLQANAAFIQANTGGGGGGNGTAYLVVTSATSGNIIPNAANTSQLNIIGLTGDITIDSPVGTATDGQRILFRIKDDGTSRTITWDPIYRAIGVTLPTVTVSSKTSYIGLIYNTQDTKWDVFAYTTEA